MKTGGKKLALLAVGMLLGILVSAQITAAAAEYFRAEKSRQVFYVDGKQVELEAYAINGNNYVKLRDIGKAVDFAVDYLPETDTVRISSYEPYTEESPVPQAEPEPMPKPSAEVNPAIFTENLTREMYNGLRESMLHRDEIISGTYPQQSLGNIQDPVSKEFAEVLECTSYQYSYMPMKARDGTELCSVEKYSPLGDAVQFTQPFVDSLRGQSQREQVEKIVWYICDHLTYDITQRTAPTSDVFRNGRAIPGVCETYAHWMKLICEQAEIPCVFMTNDDHQWNSVYVDGKWWDVDACWDDEKPREENNSNAVAAHRAKEIVFHEPGSWQDPYHTPAYPKAVRFSKELLVPGSTK